MNYLDICNKLNQIYEQKNKAYGNSFGGAFDKLGIISAVTRISDKYNRLVNLATHPDINKGNEAIEDTFWVGVIFTYLFMFWLIGGIIID